MRIHVVLEGMGVLLLFAAAGFWGLTGRESVLMMMCAVTLVALGAFQAAGPGES